MATSTKSRPSSVPAPTPPASLVEAPQVNPPLPVTPEGEESYWGDRVAFSLWLMCAVLLALLLVHDLGSALLR